MKKKNIFILLFIASILVIIMLIGTCQQPSGSSGGGGGHDNDDNTQIIKYNVIYNGNGNTGGNVPVDSTKYQQGATVTVLGNTGYLLKINVSGASYRFVGWNTQEDGNGDTYTNGQTFTMGISNVTLYALWVPYALRDIGPAGGWIFYDKGDYIGGWRYLEAAPVDQTSRAWGTYNFSVIGADGTDIGDGCQNTLDIINGDILPDKAADECANYSIINGSVTYDDWFLPSKDELKQMHVELYQKNVGGFTPSVYWSSSEFSATKAWYHYFLADLQDYLSKQDDYVSVRAVRAF